MASDEQVEAGARARAVIEAMEPNGVDQTLNAKSPDAVIHRMWTTDTGFVVDVHWWSTAFPTGGLRKATGEGETREAAVRDACSKEGERVERGYTLEEYRAAEGLPDGWVLVIDDAKLNAINVMGGGESIELDVEVLRSHLERIDPNEQNT